MKMDIESILELPMGGDELTRFDLQEKFQWTPLARIKFDMLTESAKERVRKAGKLPFVVFTQSSINISEKME